MFKSPKFLVFKILSFIIFLSSAFILGAQFCFAQEAMSPNNEQQSQSLNTIDLKVSKVSDREIFLNWQTPEKSSSIVYYGTDKSNLNKISEDALLTSHKAAIFNLEPQTKYFVKVEGKTLAGATFSSDFIEVSTNEDKKGPFNVSQIKIAQNNQGGLVLKWQNPSDSDFQEVIIKEDQKDIYKGLTEEFLFDKIESDKDLVIYSADKFGNLSGGSSFKILKEGQLKKDELNSENNLSSSVVYIFASFKNGGAFLLSPLNNQAQSLIKAYQGDRIIFSIDPLIFKKEILAAYVFDGTVKYFFKLNEKYLQTDFSLPMTKETLPVSVVIEFKDKTKQSTIFNFQLEDKPKVFFESEQNQEKIQGAQVFLYWQNELWSGFLFNQTNPFLTDQNGNYFFYVSPGNYKLQVKADGYQDFESENFTVSDTIILKDIKLSKNEPLTNLNSNSDNIKNKVDNKNSQTKQGQARLSNKTIEMLPFLIFSMLGFFVIVGSIIALILLKLHLPHYHSIKKNIEEVHKDLQGPQ